MSLPDKSQTDPEGFWDESLVRGLKKMLEKDASKLKDASESGVPEKPEIVFDRPADQSLEAFKQWVRDMVSAIGDSTKDPMTEAEWMAAWKKFWSD